MPRCPRRNTRGIISGVTESGRSPSTTITSCVCEDGVCCARIPATHNAMATSAADRVFIGLPRADLRTAGEREDPLRARVDDRDDVSTLRILNLQLQHLCL